MARDEEYVARDRDKLTPDAESSIAAGADKNGAFSLDRENPPDINIAERAPDEDLAERRYLDESLSKRPEPTRPARSRRSGNARRSGGKTEANARTPKKPETTPEPAAEPIPKPPGEKTRGAKLKQDGDGRAGEPGAVKPAPKHRAPDDAHNEGFTGARKDAGTRAGDTHDGKQRLRADDALTPQKALHERESKLRFDDAPETRTVRGKPDSAAKPDNKSERAVSRAGDRTAKAERKPAGADSKPEAMRGKADAANRPRGLPEKTRPNNLGGDKFRFEKDSKTYAKEAVKHEGGRNAAGSAARSVGNIRTNVRADAVNMGENVGVQTARGAFNQTTRATGFVAEKSVNAAKFIHSRPERLAAKAQKKAVAAKTKSVRKSANLEYKKIRAANPQTGNPISRMIQKNKIKTAYAKAAGIKLRNPAVNVAKTGAKILTSPLRAIGNKIYGATIGRAVNAVKTAVTIIKLTPAVLLTIIVVSLLLLPFGGGGGASVAASYLSTPETVNETDLIYTGWEADLLLEIANAAQANPGYDEYRYNIGVVEHSPYELLSYLSAMYGGFTLDATMINILRSIFDMQYTLSYVPETETRWREVTETDLVTGAESTEYEPYDWHVLNVVLASRPLSGVLPAMPTTEQQEIYDVYMMTKGGLQSAASPFDFNWLYMVTYEYGYHADTSSGIKYIYEGVDIAAPADTEVRAGYDGTVVETGSDHIVIESEDGVRAKYAHVASVYAVVGQTVKTGDTIAKTGADDMYFELSQGGMCYNPLFFAETNDDGTGAPGGVYSGGMTMDDLSGIVWVSGTRAGNQAVIDLALTQVGNAGGRPYWSYVGFSSRVAWCGIFAHWSYHVAGYGSGYAQSGNNFYAPTLDAWFKGAGTFRQPGYTDTAPGDVIFFDWEGDGRPNHVGLVIGRDANRVYTVEGNSRDSVRIKSYPLDSAAIYGYGLLNG